MVQNRLRLIVARMRRHDSTGLPLPAKIFQSLIAQLARRRLDGQLAGLGEMLHVNALHIKRQPHLFRQRFHESLVLIGRFAAQLMIHMRHGQLQLPRVFDLTKQIEQHARVQSAGHREQQAVAGLHEILCGAMLAELLDEFHDAICKRIQPI
ncbi:MAG: hypothetical protein ILNGONEN_01272 [Syntrophorhabdaceae bacterium]|nr:hypothetical protein [Syntrophorhabdaceae bacterium]